MKDQGVLDQIVKAAELNPEDCVLEVGPGTGALTGSILKKKPKYFTVIEKDERLVNILNDKYGDKINVINEPVKHFEIATFIFLRM